MSDVTTRTFLTTKDLAARWALHPRTIDQWRLRGEGPRFFKIGGAVRYRMIDVVQFEEKHATRGVK